MTAKESALLGNNVDNLQAAIIARSLKVQHKPAMQICDGPGRGKSFLAKLVGGVTGAEVEVSLNLADQPPSTLSGLVAPQKDQDTLKRFAPSHHDVPIQSKYGWKAVLWRIEEVASASAGSQTQMLESIQPHSDTMAGFDLAPNRFLFASGNRAGKDGTSAARPCIAPWINRVWNGTQEVDTDYYLSLLANDKKSSFEYIDSQIPWTLGQVLDIKEQIDDPEGSGVSKSLVYDWLTWETQAKHRDASFDPFEEPDGHFGQPFCTPRSLEYAMRASMLPWDFSSDVWKKLLIGFVGHNVADKISLYVEALKEEKDKVERFKNGDASALSDNPSKQYRFVLAALQVLMRDSAVVDNGLGIALARKDLTGWFTDDMLNALDLEVGAFLVDKCNLKWKSEEGADITQCKAAQRFK